MEDNWWAVCSPSPSSRDGDGDRDGEYTAGIALNPKYQPHIIYSKSLDPTL